MVFETWKQFIKHNLKDEHLNRARNECEDEVEDETKERVFDVKEDDYILKPKHITKNNTKLIIKTKPSTKPKSKTEDNIYTRLMFDCKECHEEFRKKIALNTRSYSHFRKYLETTKHFDISSSQNMKEFYITDKAWNYIEDVGEAINISLEEIKNCYQYRKVEGFKYKITGKCEYKKRTKEEVKTTKIFFNTDYIFNNAIYENGDFTQWLTFEKEIY